MDHNQQNIQPAKLLSSSILPELFYEPIQGVFYKRKRDCSTGAMQHPNQDLILKYTCNTRGQQRAIKAIKAAWMILNNSEVPEGHVLYCKNLDESDLSAGNIALVDRATWKSIREAIHNLNSALKMKPHASAQGHYLVTWKEEGVLRKKVVQDVISAKRLHRKLLIAFTKILGKYTSTV
jgi:hypothetical protein